MWIAGRFDRRQLWREGHTQDAASMNYPIDLMNFIVIVYSAYIDHPQADVYNAQ